MSVTGVLGYLPQTLPLSGDLTVAEVLGIAAIIKALDAVESGDAAEEHFTTIGDDWDIEERTAAQLDRLGLGDLPLTRRLDTLSGGQVVSLGLAGQLLKRPDVLLLDEPTNNLDLDARRKLYAVLEDLYGCLLLVSHDRALLDRMDRIAELDRGELRSYGGNFTAYTEAVAPGRRPPKRTSATPSRRSSGRSGRCSRPGSGPSGAPATPPATSAARGCRRSSPAR